MSKIKIHIFILLFFLSAAPSLAQEKIKSPQSGYFSVTFRNSVSLWGLNDWKITGLGKGTAFRIQLSKRLNSEWYGDFIKTEYKGKVFRWDRHLTNSLMYYFRNIDDLEHKFHPFISASVFCLDFTQVEEIGEGGEVLKRFSLSQQFGLGAHYYLTERADFSIYAQYYNHLGRDIHVDEHDDGTIHLEEVRGRISLEGHIFLVVSVGYRLADLW